MKKKELIIIGNGFDIKCGLKSSFTDFLNDRYYVSNEESVLNENNEPFIQYSIKNDPNSHSLKKLSEFGETIRKLANEIKRCCTAGPQTCVHAFSSISFQNAFSNTQLRKDQLCWEQADSAIKKRVDGKKITFLDAVFIFSEFEELKNWSDVEEKIKKLVNHRIESISKKQITDYAPIIDRKTHFKSTLFNDKESAPDCDQYIKQFQENYFMFNKTNENINIAQIQNAARQQDRLWYDYLEWFNSLRDFEKEFIKYLFEKEKSTDYLNSAQKLLNQLIHKPKPKLFFSFKLMPKSITSIQVLSFNYTTPFNNMKNSSVVNIHGSLKNNDIIIGIDELSNSNNSSDVKVFFTKTYRVPTNETHGQLDLSSIKTIKVFGHSLSEADYSYFQSIFDSVSLYDSKAKLIFFYSTYAEFDSDGAKHDIVSRAKKLIDKYGDTLDNKDHGKSIFHRLQLEGRVSFIEID